MEWQWLSGFWRSLSGSRSRMLCKGRSARNWSWQQTSHEARSSQKLQSYRNWIKEPPEQVSNSSKVKPVVQAIQKKPRSSHKIKSADQGQVSAKFTARPQPGCPVAPAETTGKCFRYWAKNRQPLARLSALPLISSCSSLTQGYPAANLHRTWTSKAQWEGEEVAKTGVLRTQQHGCYWTQNLG